MRPTIGVHFQQLSAAFPKPAIQLALWNEDARLSVQALRDWGNEVHVGTFTSAEAQVLRRALQGGEEAEDDDRTRWTVLQMLGICNPGTEYDEAVLLRNCHHRMVSGEFDALGSPEICRNRITPALLLIEPFEQFYQAALFLFEGIRAAATAESEPRLTNIASEKVTREGMAKTKEAAATLLSQVDAVVRGGQPVGSQFRIVLQASGVTDVAKNLIEAENGPRMLEIVLQRHADVQSRKFETGLPKGPWVRFEGRTHGARLTAQRFGLEATNRPETWSDIIRHPYRTASALNFVRLCRIR